MSPNKKNKCKHLAHLLVKTKRSLIDTYSITASLTNDLVGQKYMAPAEKEPPQSTPKKRGRKRKADTPVKEPTPPEALKTIQEVADLTDIDEQEAKKGLIDTNTGEILYLIERIVKYEPRYGYLVRWQGYPPSADSWQHEKDMPPGFTKEMKAARKRYQESQTVSPFSFQ
jgi:hypothetical protein